MANQEVNIILDTGNPGQTIAPTEYFRIVRFTTSPKDRRIQWREFDYSLIKTESIKTGGYVEFKAKKTGDGTYLLTIPAEEAAEGEYAIIYLNLELTGMGVATCTFGLK